MNSYNIFLFKSSLTKLVISSDSGILYVIITFETITDKKNIDYNLFLSIIFNIISSKIFQKKISLTGHIIGAITGILGAIIYKKIYF